jgi:hypothetical protein
MKFITNNSSHCVLHTGFKEECLEGTVDTNFLGLQIELPPKLENHIKLMIPILSGACYAIRLVVHVTNIDTSKPIYYAYCHSVVKYRVIIWGSSFKRCEDFHCTEENCQNYGWCTTQNSC